MLADILMLPGSNFSFISALHFGLVLLVSFAPRLINLILLYHAVVRLRLLHLTLLLFIVIESLLSVLKSFRYLQVDRSPGSGRFHWVF